MTTSAGQLDRTFAALADRVRAVVVPASGGTHAATGEVPAAPVGA
jgi:hypothetical protein